MRTKVKKKKHGQRNQEPKATWKLHHCIIDTNRATACISREKIG